MQKNICLLRARIRDFSPEDPLDMTSFINEHLSVYEGGAMRDRTHDEAMAELFKQDPAYAVEMLNSILEDGEQGELLIALRQMTKAFGGVQTVAEKADLNPTQLYRTLSEQGNPELRSLSAILKAMGLHLAVERVRAA
jgi:probable addiction module antidote protein